VTAPPDDRQEPEDQDGQEPESPEEITMSGGLTLPKMGAGNGQ
jgi:hypothetical protein